MSFKSSNRLAWHVHLNCLCTWIIFGAQVVRNYAINYTLNCRQKCSVWCYPMLSWKWLQKNATILKHLAITAACIFWFRHHSNLPSGWDVLLLCFMCLPHSWTLCIRIATGLLMSHKFEYYRDINRIFIRLYKLKLRGNDQHRQTSMLNTLNKTQRETSSNRCLRAVTKCAADFFTIMTQKYTL